MKNLLLIFFISIFIKSVGQNVGGYYTTSFPALATYSPLTIGGAGVTSIHGVGINDFASITAIALPTTPAFAFQYACVATSSIIVSPNGWLSFNTALAPNNLQDRVNSLDNANGLVTPNLIAPLWDDLRVNAATSAVQYSVAGTSPNRILKIEWLNMKWQQSAIGAVMSFQAWLYETTNVIEFRYRRDATVITGTSSIDGASIGLMGATTGDFISINDAGSLVSSTTATNNIGLKPANNAVYRFTPNGCSATIVAGIAKVTPSLNCTPYTSTLSLTGNSGGCNMNYLWYSCDAVGGSSVAIGSASSVTTKTVNIIAGAAQYFKCQLICGATTSLTSIISASVGAGGMGVGSFSVATTSQNFLGLTTCGNDDDLFTTATTGSITNACAPTANYAGKDVVYIFTPTVTTAFTATLSQPPAASGGANLTMALYNGCPTSTGVCVANNVITLNSSTTTNSLSVGTCTNLIFANKTYYLVIDANNAANGGCNTYSLNLGLNAMPVIAPAASCALGYTAASTPSNIVVFTGTQLLPTMAAAGDNKLSNYISFFAFCFEGTAYNGGYVSDNSSFIFATLPCLPNISSGTEAAPGVATGYSISANAPVFGTDLPRNAILAPWQDLNPVSSNTNAAARIQYTVIGTAPTRTAIISWEKMQLKNCEGVATSTATSQIKLFEKDSKIEIHIENKKTCATWNAGKAVLGLHNFNGSQFVSANSSSVALNGSASFTLANSAYRFSSTCPSNTLCVQILPIGFKDFYGDKIDNTNTLFWSTAMEQNMLYFAIERSYDGINFEQIATVNATNMPSNYEYKDYDVKAGLVAYYRLKSVEENNVYGYTKIVSIGEGNSETLSTWPIYPNPTNSEINIRLNSKKNGFANFIVYDILGNTVINETQNIEVGVNVHAVNVSALKRGVYYIEIQNNLNEVISKQKLVVN